MADAPVSLRLPVLQDHRTRAVVLFRVKTPRLRLRESGTSA